MRQNAKTIMQTVFIHFDLTKNDTFISEINLFPKLVNSHPYYTCLLLHVAALGAWISTDLCISSRNLVGVLRC